MARAARPDPPSRSVATAFSIRRLRVSGFLCALDSAHVLQLATVGQALVGGPGNRIGVQDAGEVRGFNHDTWLSIEFHIDVDLVSGHDTGRLPVGVAQAGSGHA